jgi:hypothetical protein
MTGFFARPSLFNDPAGTYIMLGIISFAKITDLDSGNGGMDKTVII